MVFDQARGLVIMDTITLLFCPLQECLISREDGKGKARDSFKVTTVFNRDT